MTVSLEERVTELEVRLAFVDEAVGTLSAGLAAHDRQLLKMMSELVRLRGELATLTAAVSHDTRNEPPPPHY